MQNPSSESALVKTTPNGDPSADDTVDPQVQGQLVEVKFPAKKAGKYNLQLMCMSGESLLHIRDLSVLQANYHQVFAICSATLLFHVHLLFCRMLLAQSLPIFRLSLQLRACT